MAQYVCIKATGYILISIILCLHVLRMNEILIQKKKGDGGWRAGSVAESTGCSCSTHTVADNGPSSQESDTLL